MQRLHHGDTRFVADRCTQNPSMGEEWRRGWHPELIAPKKSDKELLVVAATGGTGSCARPGSTRLPRHPDRGCPRVRRTGASRELSCRTQRVAPRRGLAPDADRKAPEYLRLSRQPHVRGGSTGGGPRTCCSPRVSTWRRDGIGRSSRIKLSGKNSTPLILTRMT